LDYETGKNDFLIPFIEKNMNSMIKKRLQEIYVENNGETDFDRINTEDILDSLSFEDVIKIIEESDLDTEDLAREFYEYLYRCKEDIINQFCNIREYDWYKDDMNLSQYLDKDKIIKDFENMDDDAKFQKIGSYLESDYDLQMKILNKNPKLAYAIAYMGLGLTLSDPEFQEIYMKELFNDNLTTLERYKQIIKDFTIESYNSHTKEKWNKELITFDEGIDKKYGITNLIKSIERTSKYNMFKLNHLEESLQERTLSSFEKWWDMYNNTCNVPDNFHKNELLDLFLKYKYALKNKDIFSYKFYNDLYKELISIKLKKDMYDVKEGIDLALF